MHEEGKTDRCLESDLLPQGVYTHPSSTYPLPSQAALLSACATKTAHSSLLAPPTQPQSRRVGKKGQLSHFTYQCYKALQCKNSHFLEPLYRTQLPSHSLHLQRLYSLY